MTIQQESYFKPNFIVYNATVFIPYRMGSNAFSANTGSGAARRLSAYCRIRRHCSSIVTFSSAGRHTNFDGSYTVGMPTGINIWKSSKVGFSVEVVPFVRKENGVSKINNLLFHPGILAALGSGFTFVWRAAFKISGRFGFTPIINKVIRKNKHSNYFVALPLPVRFGNNSPATFAVAFQFGLGF